MSRSKNNPLGCRGAVIGACALGMIVGVTAGNLERVAEAASSADSADAPITKKRTKKRRAKKKRKNKGAIASEDKVTFTVPFHVENVAAGITAVQVRCTVRNGTTALQTIGSDPFPIPASRSLTDTATIVVTKLGTATRFAPRPDGWICKLHMLIDPPGRYGVTSCSSGLSYLEDGSRDWRCATESSIAHYEMGTF